MGHCCDLPHIEAASDVDGFKDSLGVNADAAEGHTQAAVVVDIAIAQLRCLQTLDLDLIKLIENFDLAYLLSIWLFPALSEIQFFAH